MKEERRRQAERELGRWMWGLAAAALLLALVGSAVIAKLVLGAMPFGLAWLVVLAVVVFGVALMVAGAAVYRQIRGRDESGR